MWTSVTAKSSVEHRSCIILACLAWEVSCRLLSRVRQTKNWEIRAHGSENRWLMLDRIVKAFPERCDSLAIWSNSVNLACNSPSVNFGLGADEMKVDKGIDVGWTSHIIFHICKVSTILTEVVVVSLVFFHMCKVSAILPASLLSWRTSYASFSFLNISEFPPLSGWWINADLRYIFVACPHVAGGPGSLTVSFHLDKVLVRDAVLKN